MSPNRAADIMGIYDSPELMSSRLEQQIAYSESKSRSLIIEAETRLNSRIHELEMKLIRRGVFFWPEPETVFNWVCWLYLVLLLLILFAPIRSEHSRNSDDTKSVPPTSQSEVPVPHVDQDTRK
jgi:hypothetical protein